MNLDYGLDKIQRKSESEEKQCNVGEIELKEMREIAPKYFSSGFEFINRVMPSLLQHQTFHCASKTMK